MSKMMDIVDEIEKFIENCKTTALSKNKIVVDREHLLDLLDELKQEEPEEIKQYQKVINNRDTILGQASAQSTKLLEDAKEKAKRMVDEHEIMQQAYEEASNLLEETKAHCNGLVDRAYEESERMKQETLRYMDEVLANASSTIVYSMRDAQDRFNGLMNSLNLSATTLEQNRQQLEMMNAEPTEEDE